jgi:AcrR family transcriptional regulator
MSDKAAMKGRSRLPPKQAARRQAVLDEAALQMNSQGAGAVSLNAIADKVGLSRNALYYYVTDRADVAFRCYLRACETVSEDLAIAFESGSAPDQWITTYIERTLTSNRAPVAVLNDQDFLPEPQRATIADLNRANVDGLAALINEGIAARIFRPMNVEIAAQSLQGILSWVQLSPNWLNHRNGIAVRQRSAASIADIFLNGVAANRSRRFECPIRIEQLTARSFNSFDRVQATEQKISQLIAAASRLFNRRGIHGASLDDISASVGATKGAVYHYFDDRMDLVVQCYERAFDLYDLCMSTGDLQTGDALQRALTGFHLNCQAQASPEPPLILQPGFQALPEPKRTEFVTRARQLWMSAQATTRAGVADGSYRSIDARDIAEFPAGAFFWISKWLQNTGEATPVQIADEMSNLLVHGIRI